MVIDPNNLGATIVVVQAICAQPIPRQGACVAWPVAQKDQEQAHCDTVYTLSLVPEGAPTSCQVRAEEKAKRAPSNC